MKKIALLTDGWKRLITYAWVDGIMNGIQKSGEDIRIYQYNSYGNWSIDKKHNTGEYNIHNLPNLQQFDGIILDCNNIKDSEQLEYLLELIRKSGVPAVSLTVAIDGFYYAGIDDMEPIRTIVEHLYQKHGARNFVYAGGPERNYENRKRKQAFTEMLLKYGIPVTDDNFLEGDYDYATGERYICDYIANKKKLPDVFVCACDNIAAGICAKAEEYGLHCPQDFLVTGFDNLDKAAFFRPQITTVEHNRGLVGQAALDILRDIWAGKTVERFRFVPSNCIMSESCGCPNNGSVDYREYLKNQIVYGVSKDNYDEKLMELVGSMAECEEYSSIFRMITEYMENMACDGFYIIIDNRLFDAELNTDFSIQGYDLAHMQVAYASENKRKLPIKNIDELEDHLKEEGFHSAYLYTAIHFREKTIGYTILKNGKFLYDNPYYYDMHNAFVGALERLYKHKQIEKTVNQMRKIYNTDALTGLYNRVAYNEMILPWFERYCKENIKCAMAFFDVDNFKVINDTYGHKYGDELLKKIANTIISAKPKDGYAYRFGGDEFIVFFPIQKECEVELFMELIRARLKLERISVSIGIIISEPQSGKTLDEYLVEADRCMYEVKSARKERNV